MTWHLIDAPLLIVSGELDLSACRTDAAELAGALNAARLVTVPGLEHALAEQPGLEPAPRWWTKRSPGGSRAT